jgi:hypothetical protein
MPHVRPQSDVDTALRLSDVGILDREIASVVGVATRTVRRWRRLYQRRGAQRGQQHTTVPCPRCDGSPLDGAAYAHLLGWYLGDGYIAVSRRGVYLLSIYNDVRYPALSKEVADSLRAVKPGGLVHTRQLNGCEAVTLGWKHWPCLFPQHGPGRKHERPIVLEDWQRAIVEQHAGRFVRGLIHSDGCRVTNRVTRVVGGSPHQYEYPRYFFSNASEDILGLAMWALDLLGVQHRRPSGRNISVARADSVAVLDEHVGPKS